MDIHQLYIKRFVFSLTCLLISLLFTTHHAFAASCQSNVASGNWSDAASWTSCNGSSPGQSSGDSVQIAAGHTITLDMTPTNDIEALTIASTGSLLMAADLTVAGDVQNNGTLALPSGGELTVDGNWSNSGTFIHNDGTVTFDSGDTLITGETTFCHLVLSLTSGKTFVLTDGSTVTVAGNFNRGSSGSMVTTANTNWIMDGSCDGGGTKSLLGSGAKHFYNFEVTAGATVDHSGSGNLNIDNNFTNSGVMTLSDDIKIGADFTNNGTFTSTDDVNFSGTSAMFGSGTTTFHDITVQGSDTLDANSHDFSVKGTFSTSSSGVFTGDSNTVSFNGTSAQQIAGAGTKNFNNVALDNANGLSLASTSLAVASTIEGRLTFLDGQFDVNGEILQFGLNGTVSGSTDSNYLIADCTGAVRKRMDDSNKGFSFPIGDDTSDYSSLELTFTSGTFSASAYVNACVTDSKHPNNTASSNFLTRYWTIDSSGITSANADLTLNYLDADVNGSELDYIGGRYDGSWHVDTDAVDAATNTLTFEALSAFGDFSAGDATLPITLAYFQSELDEDGLDVAWETATEIETLGFNLYAERGITRTKLNDALIPATGYSSLTPQAYRFSIPSVLIDALILEEVSQYNSQQFGPFRIGETVGRSVELERIDWDAINAEHLQQATEHTSQAALEIQQQLVQLRQGVRAMDGMRLARLGVEADGIYRVAHADLLTMGVDLEGVASAELALLNQNQPVPISVSGGAIWNHNSAIEFFGTALNTLYTKENVYWLHLDGRLAVRMDTDLSTPKGLPAPYFMATVELAENLRYDTTNWGDDPWYMDRLIAINGPVSIQYALEVDQYAPATEPASITLELFADTLFDTEPDHHVQLISAETIHIDATFNGLAAHTFTATLPTIQNGTNIVTVTLPHDLGVPYDVIGIEALRLHYPRGFVAVNDQLDFVSDKSAFTITDLTSDQLRAYRIGGSTVTQLQQIGVASDGGTYSATFAGSGEPDRYWVTTDAAISIPNLQPAPQHVDLLSIGSADYLMIAHANFIEALTPLVKHHEAAGLEVKVVDVADVFDQFSAGIFGPQAIKDYIAHAEAQLGTRYVLLVGSDTYDYHDYLDLGSISFIPSFYRSNGNMVKWGPSDPYFADTNDDGHPNVALGRFPVRNSAELTTIISKTLLYGEPNAIAKRAIFTSDTGYSGASNQIQAKIPDFLVATGDLDNSVVNENRALLIEQINRGVAFASYFGHSSPTLWSWQKLFSSADVATLTNTQHPTLFLQYGCWNTYYVQPNYNSLAHQLMGAGPQGAAAVLGGTTLTHPLTDQLLGEAMTVYLVDHEMTIGDALQQAKKDIAQSHPHLIDAQVGYTILGDPALRLPELVPTSAISLAQLRIEPTQVHFSLLLLTLLLLVSTVAVYRRRA